MLKNAKFMVNLANTTEWWMLSRLSIIFLLMQLILKLSKITTKITLFGTF